MSFRMVTLSLIPIYIFVTTIILMVLSIKNKDKKFCIKNIIINVFFIIFGFVDLIILPQYMNLEMDLGDSLLVVAECFIIMLLAIAALIVNIVILCRKKFKDSENKTKWKSYYIFIILIPIVLIILIYFYEKILISNCDLILISNYQNGITTSKTNKYAIGDNYCLEVSIDENLIRKDGERTDVNSYDINYDENGNIVEIDSNLDEELVNIDKDIVQSIIKDSMPNESLGVEDINLRKIIGTNYYIIEYFRYRNSGSAGEVKGRYLYKGEKRISKFDSLAGLDAIVYNK